jgi:hypothetical protein
MSEMNGRTTQMSQPLVKQESPFSALSSPNGNMSRLMAAAVVDRQFRELLVADPHMAIESGYGDESFQLTPEEMDLISSVDQATSLADFAMQVVKNYSESSRLSEDVTNSGSSST